MAKKRVGDFEIAYTLYNLSQEKTLLFLHGWGSNKEIMESFKDSFPEFKLLFVDMPGFGASPTDQVMTTQKYADVIDAFIKEMHVEIKLIIGHSFGGKVATLLRPKALVLLSSAGIVEEKSLKIKAKIALFKFLKPLGGAKLRRFFASKDANEMPENMYKTFKNVVNEDFSEIFQNASSKALVFGGVRDSAVSVQSNEKIASLFETKAEILEEDHYFFLDQKNKKEIAQKIKEFYENL